jgi:hypothetical protein
MNITAAKNKHLFRDESDPDSYSENSDSGEENDDNFD